MDFSPAFRVENNGELTLSASPEAVRVAALNWQSTVPTSVKSAFTVQKESKAKILQEGGDPNCTKLVLSQSEIQFGPYRGQSFKWLLSNDVGWVCSHIASHQKERESGDNSQSPLMANKDALLSYAQMFPNVITFQSLYESYVLARDAEVTGPTHTPQHQTRATTSRQAREVEDMELLSADQELETLAVNG